MHLMEILAARQFPAAGLYLSLTHRCPLSCAHCSTNSTLASEEYDASVFLRLVESFTPADRPDIVVFTGGEPLVRPRLVRDLTARAHAAGTKVVLASGMFFARQPDIPPAIDAAIAEVDHFTVSLDVFHEQEVERASVFRVLHTLLARGQDVSVLVVGLDDDDPYLADVTSAIRSAFDDRVPVMVGLVGSVGRAKEWMEVPTPQVRTKAAAANPADSAVAPLPCDLASWPVVAYDGTVVACCKQEVVDGPVPAHLRLGHSADTDWATIRRRTLDSPLMRAIRIYGPTYLADRNGVAPGGGYCETCWRLSDDPALADRLAPDMARPAMAAMEEQIAVFQQEVFLDRHVPAPYTDLVRLGYDGAPAAAGAAR